jgi:hypothetical protein
LSEVPYAHVEAALVSAYGIRRRDLAAFRAKLRLWQKMGVLGVSPGKGKALSYTPDLIHRVIFSIELAENGVTPAVVVGTVRDLWEKRIRSIFEKAETAAMAAPGPKDFCMMTGGHSLMIGGWTSVEAALPNVQGFELRQLDAKIDLLIRMEAGDPLVPRAFVVNLSDRLRRFHAALAAAAEPKQPQVPQPKAKKKGARRRKGAA